MSLEIFAGLFTEICRRSPLGAERPLRWTVIANPRAGGFTMSSRWKIHHRALQAAVSAIGSRPPWPGAAPSRTAQAFGGPVGGRLGDRFGLLATQGPGHAGRITATLMEEIRSGPRGEGGEAPPFHLIVTAGGDGTSREVLAVLAEAPAELRSQCAVLRLPLGTGNDGAGVVDLQGALEILLKPAEPVFERGLRLSTAQAEKGPFLAFNVLSAGLDAFVTHMTNKMKGKLPGDSYKLWVDLAALFYDRLYTVGPLEVRAFDEAGRECAAFREKVLLLAVGAGGYRTYGSQKKILPDSRNVCAVRQMSLWRKIALKGLFTTGEHIHSPEVRLFNARRVEFRGDYPLLAQMDGETVLLTPEDFPAVIELTGPLIPVLKRR